MRSVTSIVNRSVETGSLISIENPDFARKIVWMVISPIRHWIEFSVILFGKESLVAF